MKFLKQLIILLLIIVVVENLKAQTNSENSFQEFKVNLEKSVVQKDNEALKGLLYDRILDNWDSFDCAGWDGCEKEMFINMFFSDTTSPHWDMMTHLLQQGFYLAYDTLKYEFIEDTIYGNIYTSPAYLEVQSALPDTLIILNDSTALFQHPSLQSTIIRRINKGKYRFNIDVDEYPVIYDSKNVEFLKLILKDGKQGYVELNRTSELIDRTLRVAMINGEWKIVEYFYFTP